jgi:hypothetical protein
VLEHVIDDGTGKGVLSVGVDVHLDDAVVQRLVDIRQLGSRATMEHQPEPGAVAVSTDDGILTLLQDCRSQHDVSGLVDAGHIAERGGKHVACAGDRTERVV